MMNSKSLYLDFHKIVRVKASGVSEELSLALEKTFSMFLVDAVDSDRNADIVLATLDTSKFPGLVPKNMKNISKFWVTEYNSEFFVVYNHRGKPDILINVGEPITLFYTPRSGCASKVIDCLYPCLRIALHRKGGLLFLGAALCRRDHCVVLTGLAGAGKTSLVLNMLQDGWDYLSEDRLILHEGRAYLFRKPIFFNYYHYETYPWLRDRKSIRKMVKCVWLRKMLRRLAIHYLPYYILQSVKLKKLYDPYIHMDPRDIFPNCNIVPSAKPTAVIVLRPGTNFRFTTINKEAFFEKITTIQRFAWPDFEAIGRLISLYGYGGSFDITEVIETNLSETTAHEVTIPHDVTFQELYPKFRQCLERVC